MPSSNATTQIGTGTRKISRQPIESMTMPPIIGPSIGAI